MQGLENMGFFIMLIANHTAYGFNYFYPSIVKGFKFKSTTLTLVLTAPPYLMATICAFCVALNSDRVGERGWHISVPMSVAVVGSSYPQPRFQYLSDTSPHSSSYAAAPPQMQVCSHGRPTPCHRRQRNALVQLLSSTCYLSWGTSGAHTSLSPRMPRDMFRQWCS